MSELDAALRRHRQAIIDREKRTFRRVLEGYKQIELELEAQIKQLDIRIQEARAGGANTTNAILKRASLNQLIDSVKSEIARFGSTISPVIQSEQRAALDLGLNQTSEISSIVSNTPFRVSGNFSRRVVEDAVGLMGDGSPLRDYFKETLAPAVADAIRNEVIKGVALGTDFKTIARRLRAAGDITRSRSLAVARTEVNRVRRETIRQSFLENPDITGWEWAASKSTRTCVLCLALDGTVFEKTEPFSQHINCRCTLLPVFFGQPTTRLLGKDWFETLSDADKIRILGADGFAAWKEGQIKGLKDFVAFKNDRRFGKSVYRRPLAQVLANQPPEGGAGGNWRRFKEKFDPQITKQKYPTSCVSAVGEMLLKGRGLNVSQEQILEIIGQPASIDSLARALNRFDPGDGDSIWRGHAIEDKHLQVLLNQTQFGAFLADDFALTRLLHAVIVKGRSRTGLIKIQDTFDQTSYEMLIDDFLKHFGGQVIFRL
jgi:SPP1 gp7 family putative phage head morphogenesis protein